jgi:hypothetical protein
MSYPIVNQTQSTIKVRGAKRGKVYEKNNRKGQRERDKVLRTKKDAFWVSLCLIAGEMYLLLL